MMKIYKCFLIIIFCSSLISCEDFIEVDTPNSIIASEVIFRNDETATSALQGIYNQLYPVAFSSGGENSVSVLAGLSANILKNIRVNNLDYIEFEEHLLMPDNTRNLSLWSSSYNIIYMCNSLLEGLENSSGLSEGVYRSLEGEVKFIRAFTYFYLVNLYENVPLILTTDYEVNASATNSSSTEVYEQIVADLQDAMELLPLDYKDGERTYVNYYVAAALMARVHLYLENWIEAESFSSEIIAESENYQLLDSLNQVFLANSLEAIWQISPRGAGGTMTFTNEGATFLFHPVISSLTQVALEDNFVAGFGAEDRRYSNWVGYHQGTENYFAYKYKDRSSIDNLTEYSMVLRLAEQYFIRAEARARQGNLSGAISDLDKIKERAGIALISENNPSIDQEALLEEILHERKKELFTEWGHRWLDLKRSGHVDEIFSTGESNWDSTDILYPIPEDELIKNSNLSQNPGY